MVHYWFGDMYIIIFSFLLPFVVPIFGVNDGNGGQVVAVFSSAQNSVIYNSNSNPELIAGQHCHPAKPCKPGVILPVWQPQEGISTSSRIFRAIVYFTVMCYLFFGVSIVADRFMAAIEVITSQEREITITKVTGEQVKILVRIWNETVSNLTLMALGSSAPEILLSVIEVFGNNFEAGDLGPSTIVGSAAFNLFIIIAVCIVVVPTNEIRRIERVDVFWITVFWSTMAYIWLYLILISFSPNVVEVWEGILTLLFFPLTVVTAFLANKHGRTFGQRFLTANITSFRRTAIRTGAPPDKAMKARHSIGLDKDVERGLIDKMIGIAEIDKNGEYIRLIQRLRNENPNLSMAELQRIAQNQVLQEMPKSRAFYRIQAARVLSGRPSLLAKSNRSIYEKQIPEAEKLLMPEKPKEVEIKFDPTDYVCLEDVGNVQLRVVVDRGSLQVQTAVTVRFTTVPDSAKEFEDFIPAEGVLAFSPHENEKIIEIGIVDNEVFEDDEQFHVKLFDAEARVVSTEQRIPLRMANERATILIIDDDHSGCFSFVSEAFRVPENEGILRVEVRRQRGARGTVRLPYKCIDGSAKSEKDFISQNDHIIFEDGQTKGFIEIVIIDDDEYEKSEDFYVELEEPMLVSHRIKAEHSAGEDAAKPVLGDHRRCRVTITEDREFHTFVDKILSNANTSLMVGTSSWKQQFSDAITAEDLDGDGKLSGRENFLHYVSLPWKLMFALIPPTDYMNGWITFFVAIFMIGVLTALIGDVAAMFGCTIGLKDMVTAITLVAMGTSLPDTFASKTAALQDKTADSSIGNVTGSNAVNVFLGIGLAWAIAAIYHAWHGTTFVVESGDLASSVTLFVIGSVVCVAILQWRRYDNKIAGELGGPVRGKIIAFSIFVILWVIYVLYSSLVSYCILPGF